MNAVRVVVLGRRHRWRVARWLSCAVLLAGCVPRDRPGEKSRPAHQTKAQVQPAASDAPRAPEDMNGAPAPEAPAVVPPAVKPSVAVGSSSDPLLTVPFSDDFDRAGGLGADWRATSPAWSLTGGRLCGENTRNHPVWLARRLPTNAVIEFQALTESPDGDIKAEYWGDGRSSATGQSYIDATSYLTIFGGWKNQFHVLARRDEHAPDRREIKLTAGGADLTKGKVVPHQVYQFRVERRDGHTLRWQVDGVDILTYLDDEPLTGQGHEHFGFNDWQVRVCFDNLRVTPLQD
jgi:hypothetical protein